MALPIRGEKNPEDSEINLFWTEGISKPKIIIILTNNQMSLRLSKTSASQFFAQFAAVTILFSKFFSKKKENKTMKQRISGDSIGWENQ